MTNNEATATTQTAAVAAPGARVAGGGETGPAMLEQPGDAPGPVVNVEAGL